MPEDQRSLLNQPTLTPIERTQEALRNIASPPQPERVTTQPTRCVTNIYSGGLQGKF